MDEFKSCIFNHTMSICEEKLKVNLDNVLN